MTTSGLLLIPLGVLLLFASWRIILIALPSFALMHGAAVFNLGSVGLQPGYFLALLIIGRTLLEIGLLRQPLNRAVLLQLLPIGLLVVISVLTLWGAVTFFQGQILVIGGTDNLSLERARPYQFRRENITQLAYIAINTMLAYAVAHQAARMISNRILEAVDRGIILSLGLATLACLWQFAAYYLGFYFPTDFFLSNIGYAQTQGELAHQEFFGYLRLSGPFLEPSALAYFFSGFLFYLWKRCRRQPSLLSAGLLISTILAIFLAYSTTGYLVLAAFAVFVAIDSTVNWTHKPIHTRELNFRRIAIWILILAAATGGVVVLSEHQADLGRIFQIAVSEKAETTSFQSRIGADLMGVRVVVETWGLGLGLGSHKPNSLVLTLLSNLGVVGTLVFGIFVFNLLFRRPPEHSVTIDGCSMTSEPMRFFIVGLLLVHGLSNPNLNELIMWVGFGLMVGYLASRECEIRTAGALFPRAWDMPAQRQYLGPEASVGRQTGST
jgi:hypothetical protein